MNGAAIETWFGLTDFRSALESDWAATLSSLGIQWEYEPCLLVLPSGERYLPDFWLPEIGTWIEVKGNGIPRVEKARELATVVVCKCRERCACQWFGGEIVLIGHPALRTAGMRFGALYWDDARYSAVLAQCGHCESFSWLRLRQSFRCRKCRVLDPQRLRMYGPGELEFRHSDRVTAHQVADEYAMWITAEQVAETRRKRENGEVA